MSGRKKNKTNGGASAASNTGTNDHMTHDVAKSDNGAASGNGGVPNGNDDESDGERRRAKISLILQKTDELRGNIQHLQDDAVYNGPNR